MNSAELKSALKTLQADINRLELFSLWDRFFNTAIQSWRGGNKGNITEQFEKLKAALRQINLSDYPVAQQRALEAIEVDRYFGDPMIAEIGSILKTEDFDPGGAAQRLEQLKQKHDRFRSLIDQLQVVLADAKVLGSEESESPSLQIVFCGDAGIESIADLKEWVDAWELIFRSFAALFELRTGDLKLVSVHKASPLVLEVGVPMQYLMIFGFACTLVLKGLEKYLKLRRAAAEIRSIDLGNQKLEQEIEASSKTVREGLAREVAEQTAKQRLDNPNGEVVNGLAISIDKLYVFIENGGAISARIPKKGGKASTEEKEVVEQIERVFAEIKRIERAIDRRLLGQGKSDVDRE